LSRDQGCRDEAFAADRPEAAGDALLKLKRSVSHDGLVSIGGNYYSVPDAAHCRGAAIA
jgi:hypothetical protein